jgi:predicted dehydrogenase
MLRVGLLGSGFMAQTHLDRYEQMDDVTVTAVASPSTADAFVRENGLDARSFTQAEKLFKEIDIDAVDICTPTPTHRPLVESATAHELDILCEKPIALTLDNAHAIRDAAADANVTLMVGHVLRFFPAYAAIREAVGDGRVGTPGTIRARRVSPFPDWAAWYGNPEQSGGVFHDLAIHEFDFCRWTIGDVDRVFAREHRGDGFHRGQATLRFESGAVGYIDAGWDRPPGGDLESEFEVAGDEGVLEYDAGDGTPVRMRTTDGDESLPPPVARDGYRRELDAFVEAVREGSDPPVSVADAIEAARLSLAARQSATQGQSVAVDEVVA